MEAVTHKKGFKLLRSNSEAVGHKTSKGFSLIEAAIVLAVVGGVIGTIWVSAANMYESYKVNKTAEGVLEIVRNTQNLISIRDAETLGNNYLLTSELVSAESFPKDWISGNSVKSPFNKDVSVRQYTGPARFDIGLYAIPSSACIKLIVKVSSMAAQANSSHQNTSPFIWYIATFSGSTTLWSTTAFPVSLDTATTACNLSSNNIIVDATYTRNN